MHKKQGAKQLLRAWGASSILDPQMFVPRKVSSKLHILLRCLFIRNMLFAIEVDGRSAVLCSAGLLGQLRSLWMMKDLS